MDFTRLALLATELLENSDQAKLSVATLCYNVNKPVLFSVNLQVFLRQPVRNI